ncbi:SLC13 family permease [Bacillus daqingensis]|uniref:SLC13 family permease n=1 Tax=Bacillus daqingensis TaxID=872396 RepID=A0ABV9NWA8_9BACI
MTVEIGFVLIVISVMIGLLITEWLRADMILLAALLVLWIGGAIDTSQAVSGLTNEGMWTVALLFLVAGAVQSHPSLKRLIFSGLGSGKRKRRSLLSMMFPIAGMSAFLNNTPIVAIFSPMIQRWCEQRQISPSKFLMPLSFAAIFGGTITLIGTSTNLLIHGLMLDRGMSGFSMFQLAAVGVPAAVFGILYMVTIGYRIMPNHEPKQSDPKPPAMIEGKGGMLPLLVLAVMVGAAALELLSMFEAAFGAVIVLLAGRVLPLKGLHRFIRVDVLLIIIYAIGIGTAVEQSGTAVWLAEHLVAVSAGLGVIGVLAAVYLMTSIFTEFITNNAAAVVMFPIAVAAALQSGQDPAGFLTAVAIAASASFATPVGYQTNLIVFRPGGYRFMDFVRVGMPLNLLYFIVTMVVVSAIWIDFS